MNVQPEKMRWFHWLIVAYLAVSTTLMLVGFVTQNIYLILPFGSLVAFVLIYNGVLLLRGEREKESGSDFRMDQSDHPPAPPPPQAIDSLDQMEEE